MSFFFFKKKTEIERGKMKDLIVIIYLFFLKKAYGWHSFSKKKNVF